MPKRLFANVARIRQVRPDDLDRVAEIEAICFPAAEAAPREVFAERIAAFPENFFLAEADGRIVGFIDGCSTFSQVICDEMFHGTERHEPLGENLCVFGLDVIPEYRRRGIAALLMNHYIERARARNRKCVILTCKENLVRYYETFGFVNRGVSASSHGGAVWFDMTLEL